MEDSQQQEGQQEEEGGGVEGRGSAVAGEGDSEETTNGISEETTNGISEDGEVKDKEEEKEEVKEEKEGEDDDVEMREVEEKSDDEERALYKLVIVNSYGSQEVQQLEERKTYTFSSTCLTYRGVVRVFFLL